MRTVNKATWDMIMDTYSLVEPLLADNGLEHNVIHICN
jgi:hypothetical protein